MPLKYNHFNLGPICESCYSEGHVKLFAVSFFKLFFHCFSFRTLVSYFFCDWNRFSIDQTTDQETIFHIDSETGAITLGKILDRETAGWHNITVKAVEAGTLFAV